MYTKFTQFICSLVSSLTRTKCHNRQWFGIKFSINRSSLTIETNWFVRLEFFSLFYYWCLLIWFDGLMSPWSISSVSRFVNSLLFLFFDIHTHFGYVISNSHNKIWCTIVSARTNKIAQFNSSCNSNMVVWS